MTLAIMFVGVGAINATTAAADCSTGTTTLRVGSKGSAVACLQAALDNGIAADGSFGPKTKARVMAWQSANGLTADGVFGAHSRATLLANGAVSGNFPAGCSSASGYSSTTGLPCVSVNANVFPAGCSSASGYSPTTGASCATGAVNNQTGPVQVMLSNDNPASGYVIANQATADLAHFTFTGTGTVNTVVLQRTGISDQNTLSNVYLYDGAVRLTDGFSFNNVGVLTMNGLGIAVNGSKNISVKADVASVVNASSLGITLIGFTAAGNTATVVSIKGNEMTYGVGNLASVYLAANTQASTATVNAGTSSYTIWTDSVQVNTRAVWLKGANFRMTGSAPADSLGNIHLYVDGVQVGSTATLGTITGSNYAMFDFTAMPVSLSTGSHTLDVRADVVKGSSYTVTASVQQASDLVIYDGQVGVNIAALGAGGAAFTSNAGSLITINAGSASVTIDPTFQSMNNVTGGATNIVIGKFKIHGYGEDVKVSSLVVKPAITSGTVSSGSNITSLNNVTIYFNGSQIGSSATYTSPTALTFNLGSQMIIPAGTDSYIEVRSDLQNSDSINYTGGTVSATLNGLTGNSQGQTSHTSISFPAATGTNTVGTSLTIQTGTLAVSKSSLANTSSNPNTDNVKIGSFNLQNQSSSESVRVTSLLVGLTTNGSTALTSSTTPALNNFSSLRTSETSGSGSTPIQPTASNTFSVDFTIAPGATKSVDVFANLSSTGSSATVVSTLTVTSLGLLSNVAISQNGNATAVTGQTITLVSGTVSTSPTLVSSSSTSAQFVAAAAGATNKTLAEFNITSSGGSANISKAKFVVRGSATVSAVGTVSSITVGGVTAPIVQATTNSTTLGAAMTDTTGTTLTLASATGVAAGTILVIGTEQIQVVSDASGTTVDTVVRGYNGTTAATHLNGATVSVQNGVAYLPGLALTIPNGGSGLNLDAWTSYAPVGTNGVTSMSLANISLAYLEYTTGNTTSTACPTSLSCSFNMAEVAAPTMALVGSKPTLALAGSTDTLGNAQVKLAEVTVTADIQGDIKLVTLPVSVSSTGVAQLTTGTLVVKDTSGNTITTTDDTLVTTAPSTSDTATITFGTGYLIPAGTSKTFRIYNTVNTVSGATNTTSLSTTINHGTATFTWLDVAGANSTAITNAQNTSYFYSYPTDTSVIHN